MKDVPKALKDDPFGKWQELVERLENIKTPPLPKEITNAQPLQALERIAIAAERLADHFARPLETQRERRPATLSTAAYTREERDRQEVRATLRGEKPKPQG